MLHRCLEKEPNRRLRDVADARIFIEDALSESPVVAVVTQPLAHAMPTRGRFVITGTVGLLIGATLSGLIVRAGMRPTPPRVERFEIASPPNEPFASDPNGWHVALSPDGSQIIYQVRRGNHTQLV